MSGSNGTGDTGASAEHGDIRERFNAMIAASMGLSFTLSLENGGVPIDIALAGCAAMVDFGLVLAEKYPDIADALRAATRAHDAATNMPISIDQAVDAAMEHLKA